MSTAPTQAQPQAPVPQRRPNNNWILWLLGIVGGLFVLLVLGGLFIAGSMIKSVRVDDVRREVAVSTPAGDLTVQKTRVGNIGLPVYPGATPLESGANLQFTTPGDDRVGISAAHYLSSDSLDKVDAWYRARLGPEFERDDKSAGKGKIRVHGVVTGGIAYVSDRDDLVRFVAISKKWNGVEIALGRIGKQETQ